MILEERVSLQIQQTALSLFQNNFPRFRKGMDIFLSISPDEAVMLKSHCSCYNVLQMSTFDTFSQHWHDLFKNAEGIQVVIVFIAHQQVH